MPEPSRCICCGSPRARRTGHDRCSRCRHGHCGRCRPPWFAARPRPAALCTVCGGRCRKPRRGKVARCMGCAMLQTWQAKAEGPHELDPPRIHELHKLAMANLPLFSGPRRER